VGGGLSAQAAGEAGIDSQKMFEVRCLQPNSAQKVQLTLGLNISHSKYVTLDDWHQKRVNTSFEKNPTETIREGFRVRHVFRRNKTGDKDRDGNPLIYALKGLKGYKITADAKLQFMNRAAVIVDSFAKDLDADFIVPLPSSCAFGAEFADLLCEVTGKQLYPADFIRKRSIAEMLAQYGDTVPEGLSENARNGYKSQLAAWRRLRPGQLMSMKEINPKIRLCFDPIALSKDVPALKDSKIVISDDLMASGASMISVSKLFRTAGCNVTSGICFLSGL
jgi:hypothetical protein